MAGKGALPVQRYIPNRQRQLGLRVYGEMFRELIGARELLWRLIWRDVLLRVKVSFLGLFWSVAQPLALMLVFLFLRQARVLAAGPSEVPYALFAFFGLLHWNLFSSMLTQSSGSLLGAANLVAKVRFPREVLVFSACARALFDWLCALPVLALLYGWAGVAPPLSALALPLVLLPLLFLGAGLGLLLAMLALPIRDILQALPLLLMPLLFLSPVVYELPASGLWWWVRTLNPLAAFFGALRDLCFHGALRAPEPFFFWSAFSVFFFLASWRAFHLVMPKVPEYA